VGKVLTGQPASPGLTLDTFCTRMPDGGHLKAFGVASDGWLRGERNADELPKLTIVRTWQRARARAFTEDA
jgi:hypothetical protein